MVDGEWSVNAGSAGRIRIKGNQHIVAMDFDVAALQGRKIIGAEIVCVAAAEEIAGVTVSTIATPWSELDSTGLIAGVEGIEDWGYAGARFPAVSGGNSFTLVQQSTSEIREGTYHWAIEPDMVSALVTGVAFGLAIHEHDADYTRNPTIYSREQSSRRPYLLVDVADEIERQAPPSAPTEMKLTTSGRYAAELVFQAPRRGFAYEVSIDGFPVGRHNIPLVQPGEMQTVNLRDLPKNRTTPGVHEVAIVTVGRTGLRSQPTAVRGRLFDEAPIRLPKVSLPPAQAARLSGVSVIPVADKYDQQGRPVGELPRNHRSHNSLFDGGQIHLTAAAGEVVGYQAVLRGSGDVAVRCRLDNLHWRIDRFVAAYVDANGRRIPDPLLPMPDTISLSQDADQSVFVDIFVPFDAVPGTYQGALTISDGRSVPLDLIVLPISLPRSASFHCEMNSYGLPDHVDEFYALQQVAYDHRVHANILHYSHHTAAPGARKSNLDMRLSSGRRMDNRRYDDVPPGATEGFWDDFAEAFGPYLDGSFFRDGHRGPIVPPGFYLTFHESWPLNCRSYFNGDPDAYRAFTEHPVYAETYVNILRDFVRLADSRGWGQAGFQVYLNNKGSLNEQTKAPWILDEPTAYWDYRALQYYGELTDRGVRKADGVRVDYRIDISRPEYCRGRLAGRSDFWVVASSAFSNYRRLIKDRMRQDDLKVWVYGTSNPVQESNRQVQAWAIDAWQHGATGLVPWQTVDKSGEALEQADQLGLFIFDHDAGGNAVIRHSARLKAYREAEQLIEYLILVRERYGYTAEQMQTWINHYAGLTGAVRKHSDEDAGTAFYKEQELVRLDQLRLAAIEMLR